MAVGPGWGSWSQTDVEQRVICTRVVSWERESDFLTLSQVARRMELPSSEMGVAEGGAGIGEDQELRSSK